MNSFSRLMTQLRAEHLKGRRRHLLFIPLTFLSFQLLWGSWQLELASQEELYTGFLLMFHHLPIMNTLLLPMMTAVLASRLCDMETKGDTLKLLYTMQKQSSFFDCKYLTGLKYLILFTLGQGVMVLAWNQLYRFGEPLKYLMLFQHLAVTLSVSALLLAIQQLLSLLSSSQILPLAAGLVGCFLGLFSLFFPSTVARFFVWGYYAAFPVAAMDWERNTRITRYYEISFPTIMFLLFLLGTALIYLLCKTIILRKEE